MPPTASNNIASLRVKFMIFSVI